MAARLRFSMRPAPPRRPAGCGGKARGLCVALSYLVSLNGECELAGHVAAVQRIQRSRQFMHFIDLADLGMDARSEEHTSELQHSQISYAVFCLKKKKKKEEQ